MFFSYLEETRGFPGLNKLYLTYIFTSLVCSTWEWICLLELFLPGAQAHLHSLQVMDSLSLESSWLDLPCIFSSGCPTSSPAGLWSASPEDPAHTGWLWKERHSWDIAQKFSWVMGWKTYPSHICKKGKHLSSLFTSMLTSSQSSFLARLCYFATLQPQQGFIH